MISTDYTIRAFINKQKRLNQIKLYKIVFIIILTMVFILLISFLTDENNKVNQHSYKYYKSIQITKGDTLWSIAYDHFDSKHYSNASDYVKEVKKMNNLTSDDIIAGSYIIIPYYLSEWEQREME
ncbi:cell division suppressor protein YneA [Lachnospiraceae bacterium]|nr:cell division suppressor protein YneA [Lachnospiraceae bacterium]